MTQKDITALSEIIKHNIPIGTRRIALINTLISYLESEYSLDISEINSLRQENPKPVIPTIVNVKAQETPFKKLERDFDKKDKSHLDVIPKVLCRLQQETGYGLASEDNDG